MRRPTAPQSLGAQLALLVAGALLVAQAINFMLLLRAEERQIFLRSSAPAIAQIAEAIQRGQAERVPLDPRRPRPLWRAFETATSPVMDDMRRRADIAERAEEMLGSAGITVRRIAAAEVTGRQYALQFDELRGTVRQAGGQRQTMIIISAETAPGRWISSVAPLPERDNAVVGWLLFQTLVLYGVVLLPVLWIGGNLARPLAELRRAADGFKSNARPEPIAERGPDDVRALIAAFNLMRTRVIAMLLEKDRMLGAIGHDLRTPLASLRVRTEWVEDEVERDRMAATIDDMNKTLDDILSLARLGRPSEPATRVDLPALVDSVIEDFRDLGADVTLEDSPRLAVSMRPNLVKRAVRNLIENALKYGDRARVRIGRADGGASVEIEDDGPGIPDHEIQNMFEPFTRLDSSRNRETGGSGLGLALAQAIATAHNGRLTLANRPDGGLNASLWLPAG